MPMTPHAGESQTEFMSRCVSEMMSGDRPQDQAVAICLDIWNNKGADAPIRKETTAKVGPGFEYVLSDATLDRYGDRIDPKGWVTTNFNRNPIALFNHDAKFPIGKWTNVKSDGSRLVGKLKLAEAGTSQRIDEIISLVRQGILKAVSVGFQAIDKEPLKDGNGIYYKKQELLEASIVSVPANPASVQLARSMGTSAETLSLVFGEHALRGQRINGEHAEPKPSIRLKTMNLSERIENAQAELTRDKDALTAHLADENAEQTVTDELTHRIETKNTQLESLKRAETALAAQTAAAAPGAREDEPENEQRDLARRPYAVPAQKIKPVDYFFRSLTVAVLNHTRKEPLHQTLKTFYGDDPATKAVMNVILRAATVPADTVTSGWASQLVNTGFGEFIQALIAVSVYPGLSNRGGRFTFGRNGIVSIPSRASTPTVAGSFIAQGAPIPVRQAGFAAITLTPKKMGVITTMTREISEHSTPAIEQLLRRAITEDTGVAIDTVLLDANAATTTRPAGIRNGATTAAGTAGGTFAALVTDLKGMIADLVTNTNGNIRDPVWIFNPINRNSIALAQNAGGDFPFKEELGQGTLLNYPVIVSSTVPSGTIILIDAADFASATGDDPRFDVSDQAVLHMEDTTPLAIGTVGAPNTVAAPVRSLWQTDSIGIRMLLDINWAIVRTAVVSVRTAVSW
jgi:HK97 family phage prohead protease/HK97 family phage major capsid protein